MKRKLEICVDSVDSAIAAQKGGADRIELCGNLVVGGTTPSSILFSEIKKKVDIPVRVLIRPRFGDFCYSENEFSIISGEITMYRNLGADAVVVGCLCKDGGVNLEQMQQIVKAAGSMQLTFHRAFDVCKDPYIALEQIKQLGIGTVLTSGQKNCFQDGKELLRELVQISKNDIDIMPGGGVTPETLKNTASYIGANVYHMSAKVIVDSIMEYRKEDVNMGLPSFSEYEIWQTSEEIVRKAKEMINQL